MNTPNDQDLQPTPAELQFLADLRLLQADIPTENDLLHLREQQTLRDDRKKRLQDFLSKHQNSLSGAISRLLGVFLYFDDGMRHPEALAAYRTLYLFNELLHPPHEIEI